MKRYLAGLLLLAGAICESGPATAQEVKTVNSKSWELNGLIQAQHSYNQDIASEAERTNEGFRLRRVRFQARAKLTDFIETNLQIDVRDNSPRLKDAEGRITLFQHYYVRAGQFKVPFWREELRSSSRLLLIERSAVAEFLIGQNISARHLGFELGRSSTSGLGFALNFSNGSGEGNKEDAGTRKDGVFINNGKLLAGRANYVLSKSFQLGLAAAHNHVGNTIGTENTTGTISAIAPDLNWLLKTSERNEVEFESGVVFGERKSEANLPSDRSFAGFDITGRYRSRAQTASANWGGLEGWELAGGFSWVDDNRDLSENETSYVRFGPALLFGKTVRLQFNGELVMPNAPGAENTFIVRSQANFIF